MPMSPPPVHSASDVLRDRFGMRSSGLSQQAVLASVGMCLWWSGTTSEAAQEAYSSARTDQISELAAKASHSGRAVGTGCSSTVVSRGDSVRKLDGLIIVLLRNLGVDLSAVEPQCAGLLMRIMA